MALLAKPNQTLEAHTEQVMQVAQDICKRLQLPHVLVQRIMLACLMHDVGKATHSFQRRIQGTAVDCSNACPHALAALPLILWLEAQRFGQNAPKLSTAAVLTHHSPLHPELYQGYDRPPDFDAEALRAWLQAMLSNKQQLSRLLQSLDQLLSVNPSNWLHSERQYPDGSRTLMQQLQRLPVAKFSTVKGALCLADWLASAGEDHAHSLFLANGRKKLQHHLQQASFDLYTYQKQAQQQTETRLYLQAPTGAGKTEALLLWAGDDSRLIYLLPTQATVNAMYRRLQAIYGKEAVGIAHSRVLLELSRDEEEPPLDKKLFSSVFATPITVATLDQYLLAHLHGRHWEIRRFLCRHATVLMDEIHAYEPYTLGLLKAALQSDAPARLAIASATLPSPLRQWLGSAPLIVAEDALWQQQRHRLIVEQRSPTDALADALQAAERGEVVLFVVNTIRLAQRLYQKAVEEAKSMRHAPSIHLLHARFTYRDRRRKEEHIQQPASGTLLIATQVVEVSLDISYGRLYTELAPLDALIQRMGRVNRKGEQKQPAPVHLLAQYDPGSEHIYDKLVLQQTLTLLNGLPSVPTNGDLRDASDQLYNALWGTGPFQQELQEGEQALKEVQQICGCYTIGLKDEQMRQRFATRKGEINIEVLPEQFLQEAYQMREQKQLWRLPELLVPVPYRWLDEFPKKFCWKHDLEVSITKLPYDDQIGLQHPLDDT